MNESDGTKDIVAQVDELPIEAEFALVSILALLRVFGFCAAIKLLAQQWLDKYGPNRMCNILASNAEPVDIMAQLENM